MNKSALGIIFRIPEYGKIKKRLAAHIGNEEALKAYSSMLHETFKKVRQLSRQDNSIDVYGFYDGTISKNESLLKDIQTMPQDGRDLGEKMYNAIKYLHETGYKKFVLIGADSPDLPIHYIKDAFLKLNDYELVLGPTEDGGYYLIGMNRPLSAIFKDIQWGSSNVLHDTIKKAENKEIRYFLIPFWYDIDTPDDLNRWRHNAKTYNRRKAADSPVIDICNNPCSISKKGRIYQL